GLQGHRGTASYSASKAALLGLSRVLGKEYARFNVTSNVLVLGHFDAGLYRRLDKSTQKALLKEIPSGRLGQVSNIVHAIYFLRKSDYVNASEVSIDGGL